MRKIILLLFALPLGLQAQIGTAVLETSDARLQIPVNGMLFHDVENQDPGYEAPLGSGNHTLFSSSIWMGGVAPSGNLHLAGIAFCEGGSNEAGFCEFYPGPLKVDGSASTTEDVMELYNRVWLVNRTETELHIAYFDCLNDAECNLEETFPDGYDIPESFTSWPAHGDVSLDYAPDLAPFIDLDDNGIYNPESGDYPEFCGDKAAYLILNDAGLHFETVGAPLGLEMHTMVYSYDTEGPLGSSVFVRQRLINRSGLNLENTYVGVWSDFDIGHYGDDFIGTDVERGMVYAYNGPASDDQYGDDLPAMGCIILDGPLETANGQDDVIPFDGYSRYGKYGSGWGDGIVDNETIGLSKSIGQFGSGAIGMPSVGVEYYNYLRGHWKSGAPLVHGGSGYDGIGSEMLQTDYVFPGVSDPMFAGTGGVDPEDLDENGWTEISAGLESNDRKMIASMGPFIFSSGSEETIEYAYVFAQQSQDPETPVIDLLGLNADEILELQCTLEGDITTGLISVAQEVEFSLYPNPSTGEFTLNVADENAGTYRVFNIVGQEISNGKIQFPNTSVSLDDVIPGMYFVNVKIGEASSTKKVIVED